MKKKIDIELSRLVKVYGDKVGDMIMLKLVDYIKTVRANIHKRIKEARIEVYNDHVAGCDECQGGYEDRCEEGSKLLRKC